VPDALSVAREAGVLALPGALTPTEVVAAWEAGADVVKIFPSDLGGPAYLKALRGPMPQVRMMPTGGVDLDTAEAFLKAGACCLGAGSSLVEPKAVAAGDFGRITEMATRFAATVAGFRAGNARI
jgi:2-dehydro-3-deoxyphosphogluconate aldolase/(4S)-4-hydroxy-2-oxoglutarate aldolase